MSPLHDGSQWIESFMFLPKDTAPFACVYYNKDLFDAAGLPYPKDDWDWDEFLNVAQQLTQRDAQGKITQWGFLYMGMDEFCVQFRRIISG